MKNSSRDWQPIIQALSAILPAENLLITPEQKQPFECDGLPMYRQLPGLVALPENTEQIIEIMKICKEFQLPIVPRGSGTSLSGGARPLADGIVIAVSKMQKILAIDPLQRTARVQAGVRNLSISEAAKSYGLYYAPDPSSQVASSIGGNIAENAGGVHCLKYGLTVHNVIEVTFITGDAEKLTIGGSLLDAPGLDLLSLLHGSEGMFGIIVEVVVRLLPLPETAQVLLAAFSSSYQAGAAVSALLAEGIIPAGLEMMDKLAIHAAEAFAHIGYPLDAEAILLCELDGNQAQVIEDMEKVRAILRRFGSHNCQIAVDQAQRQAFWRGRKAAFPAVGRLAPDYYCMDGSIPRRALAEVLDKIAVLAKKYDLAVANVFHAGDGNLHPLILFDANQPDALAKAEALGGEILELCLKVGGSITGEHGVGVEKLNQMCLQFNDQERDQFFAVRRAFDAQGLCNPDKAIPSLARCAEFGALHVHHGALPHPDVPRF